MNGGLFAVEEKEGKLPHRHKEQLCAALLILLLGNRPVLPVIDHIPEAFRIDAHDNSRLLATFRRGFGVGQGLSVGKPVLSIHINGAGALFRDNVGFNDGRGNQNVPDKMRECGVLFKTLPDKGAAQHGGQAVVADAAQQPVVMRLAKDHFLADVKTKNDLLPEGARTMIWAASGSIHQLNSAEGVTLPC